MRSPPSRSRLPLLSRKTSQPSLQSGESRQLAPSLLGHSTPWTPVMPARRGGGHQAGQQAGPSFARPGRLEPAADGGGGHADQRADHGNDDHQFDQGPAALWVHAVSASSQGRGSSLERPSRPGYRHSPGPPVRNSRSSQPGQKRRDYTGRLQSAGPNVRSLRTRCALRARRRPAGGDPSPDRGLRGRPGAPDAAGRDRFGQDLHHRQRDPGGAEADPGAGAEQDAGRAAVRRVQELLPAQRGRVFRQLLRLLPARGLRRRRRDTFIEKDSSINEHIEQMRLSATKALLERRDTIIVATVSAIYGLGDPNEYFRDGAAPGPRRQASTSAS